MFAASQDMFSDFFTLNMAIFWLGIATCFFGFQYIGDVFYASVTKKNFTPNLFKGALDLIIWVIFFFFFVQTLGINLKDTSIDEGFFVLDWN